MRRLDVMDEIRQVGELDPALVELANIQQEYGHLALSLTRSATCVCVCLYGRPTILCNASSNHAVVVHHYRLARRTRTELLQEHNPTL